MSVGELGVEDVGLRTGAGHGLGDLVEEALARLIAARGLPASIGSGQPVRLEIATGTLPSEADPDQLAELLARALARALGMAV